MTSVKIVSLTCNVFFTNALLKTGFNAAVHYGESRTEFRLYEIKASVKD